MNRKHFVHLTLLLSIAFVASQLFAQQVDQTGPLRTLPVFHRNQALSNAAHKGLPFNVVAASATFGGTPYSVGPTITPVSASMKPEAEQHIAQDPLDDSQLVATISDFSLRGGFNTTAYSVSFNTGGSWTPHFIPTNNAGLPATSDGGTWQANSDPVVAVDKPGNVFLFNLYLAVKGNKVSNDGLYVSIGNLSTGVSTSVANTKPIRTTLKASSSLEDKPWGTVDTSSNAATTGNVYACWTHFTSRSNWIWFSDSTNHGSTWSAPLQVSPVAQNGGVQGCQVAVGSKGEVFVAWEVFFTTGSQIWIAKSTNGGSSFGTAVAASPMYTDVNFSSTYRKNSFPALAVNPVSDVVYIVYADQPGANSAMEFIHSTTAGGIKFSAPVHINDNSAGQRVFPAVSVDANGVIGASWVDTRNSPMNANLYDVFATRSLNGGGTFAPNARVTAKTINLGNSTSSFIGDYSGMVGGLDAHPVWNSGGFGNGTTAPLGQLKTAFLQ